MRAGLCFGAVSVAALAGLSNSRTWASSVASSAQETPVNFPFSMKGTTVTLNTLYPGTLSYQPKGWDTLSDLRVNLLRIGGGTEGDVAHFNMNRHPNEWAQNLEALLSKADSQRMKVTFLQLGNKYGTMFDIVAPEPDQGITGTSVETAKVMIDKLAGNNALQHNFIADPRIFGWSVANEVDLAQKATYDWCISILDYIRSKGGKAYLGSPYDTRIGSDWIGNMDFRRIEPQLRGHVDYLQLHIYQIGIVDQAIRNGQDVYVTMYSLLRDLIQRYMIEGRGSVPLSNLIIGEFGIWHGEAAWGSATYSFGEATRAAYYEAMFRAAADSGIRNLLCFCCFDQNNGANVVSPPFGIVNVDGNYFTSCTSVLQKYYKSPLIPLRRT